MARQTAPFCGFGAGMVCRSEQSPRGSRLSSRTAAGLNGKKGFAKPIDDPPRSLARSSVGQDAECEKNDQEASRNGSKDMDLALAHISSLYTSFDPSNLGMQISDVC
jgi:hypothetical protein